LDKPNLNVEVYTNPFYRKMNIQSEVIMTHLELYNSLGNKNDSILNLSSFSGLLFLRERAKDRLTTMIKLIKLKIGRKALSELVLM